MVVSCWVLYAGMLEAIAKVNSGEVTPLQISRRLLRGKTWCESPRLRGPYRALVVDDDAMVRLTTRRTLEEAGIRHVDEAKNGEACLKLLSGVVPYALTSIPLSII